ncbi:TadE/TadG family type IV pilus assembly protein [Brevundimonas sp. 374]|uniref:TadE/TadG family type IV pilus assembly protein n=1 Tax=Brevundimonas sp. 374 TaxID=1150400 RepID=UPI00088CDC3A|nr:TadE/TadG family type IV pilus assembly protein [Brevundimonas sp. 374]SDQ90701.1 TadE-like protein [Brevundimonas sp. 374]
MRARRSLKPRFSPFRRKRDGSAAVEFAMVAIPFFLMIFSILELGVVFVLDSVLETAAMDSGRLIRTGQAHAQGFDKTKFKAQVCSKMVVFKSDCDSRMTVDVRVIPKFSAPAVQDPITNNAMDDKKTIYNGGKAGDLILVRIWYAHPLATPLLSQAVSRIGTGKVLLTATTAFRNEPWQ